MRGGLDFNGRPPQVISIPAASSEPARRKCTTATSADEKESLAGHDRLGGFGGIVLHLVGRREKSWTPRLHPRPSDRACFRAKAASIERVTTPTKSKASSNPDPIMSDYHVQRATNESLSPSYGRVVRNPHRGSSRSLDERKDVRVADGSTSFDEAQRWWGLAPS